MQQAFHTFAADKNLKRELEESKELPPWVTTTEERLLAKNSTDPKVLRNLALNKAEDHQVLCYIAANPSSPPDVLRTLAKKDVEFFLAQNPSSPPDVLRNLVRSEKEHVAANPSTPPDVLRTLSKATYYKPTGLPGSSCDLLADINVIRFVASNPSTPPDVLRTLSKHGISVTWHLCNNNHTPMDLVRQLDPNHEKTKIIR